MANSSIMDTLFQRSLEDLIKGIRLYSSDSSAPISAFLTKAMDEIRKEIKSIDPHTKSTALLKLTYLSSLYGFGMKWAAFNIVEVISYPQFSLKRIGYLAAAASFNEGTEVLLLVTNQFRKDLSSPNDFEVSLALQCLSVIGTADLCRDLCHDLFTLLSSTRSYIKKKAIAVVLRVFSKYPDSVRVCFKRLVENLESSDPQTVCSAVGVFCELALREPKAYLPLAPEFYRILVDCKNNWVLIKVLKIFSKLALLEPRLGKKIAEPICEIMQRTMAKSLLYECIRTVVSSLSSHDFAVKLAVLKIRELLVEDDSNLRYLGLRALSDLAPKHLLAILENKEAVVKALSDVDLNIRLVSLRLVMVMVSEDNVAEITKILVNYALKSDPEFCNEILRSILFTCSRNYYELVFDFDWYVSLLGEMARVPHCQAGEEIENQLVDIGMRVKDARPELVSVGRSLLIDPALLGNPFLHNILSGAAWVSGEYAEFSKNHFELMEALLQPRTNLLPPSIRAVYIQSAIKVLVFCHQSYIWQHNEVATSSVGLDSQVESQLPEGCDSTVHGEMENSDHDVGFYPRGSLHSFNENENEVSFQGPSFPLPLSGTGNSTREIVVKFFNLVENALGPLSWSHEVEVQDRARNVLAVVRVMKQDISQCLAQHEASSGMINAEPSETTKFIVDLFAEELGPVSVTAQAKVLLPDGLVLQDNLCELDMIYSDMQLDSSASFSLGATHSRDKEASLIFYRSKEDSESSSNSGSLLAEHRQRHDLYYLPSEKDDAGLNDYPPANESTNLGTRSEEVNDLVKLTEQSLTIKKKPKQSRPRPVVKLDEGENFIPTKKLESTDDLLSGAVRDILLESEEVTTSSEYGAAAKLSSKRKGKEKLESSVIAENYMAENPGSRRSNNKTHGRERRHRSHGMKDERTKEISRKDKKKSHHHNSRHKAQGEGGESNKVVQTPQVPDFLL